MKFEQGKWENIPDVRGKQKTVGTKVDLTFTNKQPPPPPPQFSFPRFLFLTYQKLPKIRA